MQEGRLGNWAALCYLRHMKTVRFRQVIVEIPAAAAAGREFSLGTQQDLVGAIIDGIETFDITDTPTTADGNPVVTAADAVRLALYVNQESNDKVLAIPYGPSRVAVNSGRVREYDRLRITWEDTRIRVTQVIANVASSWAVIGVHYHYPKDLTGGM